MAIAIKTHRLVLAIAGIAMTISCTRMHKPNEANLNSSEAALKNWALSYCIASILEPGPAKQDALNTAGAYLEAGNQPIEAYEKTTLLIKSYLARNYTGVTQGTFNTKKCIDLYESRDLELIVQEFKK
jgi:hypothetical protein